MSSLTERIELLESDLKSVPPRISVYHDLPFAILRYDPTEEWELRRQVKLLGTRLEAAGKDVHLIPMSEFLWRAIEETEGLEAVVSLERERGYIAAQDQVTTYLSDRDWRPLGDPAGRATVGPRPGPIGRLPDPGDGERVGRSVISATDRPPFGSQRFRIPLDATGKTWVRFSAWDSAGNGAFTQSVRLK